MINAQALKIAGYNSAPDAEQAARILNEYKAGDWATVEDYTDQEYWQNDDATIVLRINNAEFLNAIPNSPIHLAELVHELRPDEFNVTNSPKGAYLRLWWD